MPVERWSQAPNSLLAHHSFLAHSVKEMPELPISCVRYVHCKIGVHEDHISLFFLLLFFGGGLLVLISVKTGLSLRPWANVVIDLRVEVALHDILLVLVVVIACACPAAWGIGDLHQTAAVEEEPCPSAVGSMSPRAVDLVEEEAFGRFFATAYF